MKKRLLVPALFIFLATFSSAIVINEFTTDPQTDWDGSGSATSSDEFIELFNPSNETVDLTEWKITINDSTSSNATIQSLNNTISANSYKTILKPQGGLNNAGQIFLFNNLGEIIDSVTYGSWDDGNESDNAPDGNAEDYSDECIARIPNGQDTNIDSSDFVKTECTFNLENKIISPSEQNIIAIIGGKIIFNVFPRRLDFGLIYPNTQDNPALNGPITFDVGGSEADVQVEITEVLGEPFHAGLKIDNSPWEDLGPWIIPFTSPIQTANVTLDVDEDTPPGQAQGTIVYTVTGLPPQ